MSSAAAYCDRFLGGQGFERAPWLVVAFALGIAAWFVLDNARQWAALAALLLGIALLGAGLMAAHGRFPFLRQALVAVPLMALAGMGVIWAKSELVGAVPIARPVVARFAATVLDRQDQPAEERVRLVLATREPGTARPIRVRVNLPLALDRPGINIGARLRLRLRLMPPAPPMLPGGYDFARTAWFAGLSATGTVMGEVELIGIGRSRAWLHEARAALSTHVHEQLGGSAGGIAAAFASGDRGAIAVSDEEAMRDAGLTHLLSVSGLHVSAVIGGAYFVAVRLLALWPWLALRVRLPIVGAGVGAAAGVGYTLLTGAEVPTVRSCVGALLVLGALALGREALSLRMLAAAAFLVLLLWPEAIVGASFQLSFAAVIAIIALHGAAPMKRYLAPRDEGMIARGLRSLAALLATGIVVELALIPIGLFHFHRAGIYGALANVVAIPLTTILTMPLIALALLLDIIGAGAPAWWLCGRSIDALLALAHWIAGQPGAVTHFPALGRGGFALFVAGSLWLALWRGRVRLWGCVPIALGTLALAALRPPDLLISGDGRHVGITGESDGELLVLRAGKSSFATDTLSEIAGMGGSLQLIADSPGARCNADFCTLALHRAGRDWHLLISRGRDSVPERALAAACERVDIVIADRWLPRSCHPTALKADRALLARTGGLALNLAAGRIATVAQTQGEHGWWRPQRSSRASPARPSHRPWLRAKSVTP
ncbi:MAG: ComEC/Rec2 family competence protein [Novosphingobium sp.]